MMGTGKVRRFPVLQEFRIAETQLEPCFAGNVGICSDDFTRKATVGKNVQLCESPSPQSEY